ncbi:MAG: TolC family protein [Desulfobacterales bacterium]|nr:TolC family protein [Desulfobacterales bacterium]
MTRQDVILDAKNAYFSVLKTQKLLEVAQQTVTSISSQKEVSENFYKVGPEPPERPAAEPGPARQRPAAADGSAEQPRNRQDPVQHGPAPAGQRPGVPRAGAGLHRATADTLDDLPRRRPRKTASRSRWRMWISRSPQKQVKLSGEGLLPHRQPHRAYARTGDDWQAHGGEGISDAAGWNVQATATWNFWEWGRTGYGRKEKLARLAQSKYKKSEVTGHHQPAGETGLAAHARRPRPNIVTIEKAVEQAKENLRITEEQYKEQVATQTDVLDRPDAAHPDR